MEKADMSIFYVKLEEFKNDEKFWNELVGQYCCYKDRKHNKFKRYVMIRCLNKYFDKNINKELSNIPYFDCSYHKVNLVEKLTVESMYNCFMIESGVDNLYKTMVSI